MGRSARTITQGAKNDRLTIRLRVRAKRKKCGRYHLLDGGRHDLPAVEVKRRDEARFVAADVGW